MSDNKMSYTSRDYISIFDDLINSIPSLTNDWTTRDETDPGIVLIKLMSMLGDMLSYNQDMKALEVYPSTVKERKNALQIFNGILGYKMKWYKSAKCYCEFQNSSSDSVIIPRFSTILSSDNKIAYTNSNNNLIIPPMGSVGSELIQGIPVTPNINSNKLSNSSLLWHEMYDWNITPSDIINNIYYLNYANIDQDNIFIISNSLDTSIGEYIEWQITDNVDLELSTDNCFEFNVDEDNRPYIKFHKSWSYYANKFKIFYLISDGSNGKISQGSLNKISSSIYSSNNYSTLPNNIINVQNEPSTDGYDPESIEEARISSQRYRNSTNSLITIQDFRDAILKMDYVNNCYVTDCTCDPDPDFPSFAVKAYIVRSDNFQDDENSTNGAFSDYIITQLNNYKIMPLDIVISTDEINYYYWTVKGEVFLTRPCNVDEIKELLVSINNKLIKTYSTKYVEFNSVIRYIDVIDTIKSVSSLIHYIDLDAIEYYDKNYNKVDKSKITGKHTITLPYKKDSDDNKLSYYAELSNYPIKPGSLKISINNGQHILTDDGNGNIISYDNFIRPINSKINYGSKTSIANIKFELYSRVYEDIIVEYQTNSINMIKYINLNTKDFNVNKDSMK